MHLYSEYRGGRGEVFVLALVGGRWTLMKFCICKVSGVEGVLIGKDDVEEVLYGDWCVLCWGGGGGCFTSVIGGWACE